MGEVSAGNGPTKETPSNGEGIVALGFFWEQFIYDGSEVVRLNFGERFAFEFWVEMGIEEPFVVAHGTWADALGLALEEDGERVFKPQGGIVSLAEGSLCEKF